MLFNSSLHIRRVIVERGFTVSNAYFERLIQQKGWEKFASHPPEGVGWVGQEFYANVLYHRDHTCWVRGKWVPLSLENINIFYALGEVEDSRFGALPKNIN